jgi:hypothetical protein
MRAELFHADGQKDEGWTGRQAGMTKVTAAFRNVANVPRNGIKVS